MHNQNIDNYTLSPMLYDDHIMHQAESNVFGDGNWKGSDYNLTTHNCQDFANALKKEYQRLGGQTTFSPFGSL